MRREDGFTLVELLVVMVLLGVIGGVVTTGIVTAMRTTRDTQNRVEVMAQLQRATENVSREVRAACPVVGSVTDPKTVTVAIQRGGDQLRHRYRIDAAAGTLIQSVTKRTAPTIWTPVGGDRVLLRGLNASGSSFGFLNAGGSTTAIVGDVRTVKLNLTKTLPNAGDVRVETAVSLRNGGRSCD